MIVTQYLAKDLFKGKTVFVTGGGSGINLGVAKNFAALGANLAICGRTLEKLEAAAAELATLGAKVCPVVADVRDFAAMEAAFVRSRDELGPMDVLVCGAAGNFVVPAETLTPNGFKTVIDIDLLGSFNASRGAFEQLRATKGTIIFISAGMAYMPHAFQVHVGGAKAGIDMMMKNLAIEWGLRHSDQQHRARADRGHRGSEAAVGRRRERAAHQCHSAAAHGWGRRYRPDCSLPRFTARVLHFRVRRGG